jgi:SAM-dependent methyltransferase
LEPGELEQSPGGHLDSPRREPGGVVASDGPSTGTSSGITPDGSPVAVYLALPVEPAFTPVLEWLRSEQRVLDLGCGVGRLANELVRRGFEVVAVDESPEMLVHVDPRVRTVEARIEDLDLRQVFDVVVLASHFVNVADLDQRDALLRSCVRHVAADGEVLLERYDPIWAREVEGSEGEAGPVHVRMTVLERDGDEFAAVVRYELGDESWEQPFQARAVDDDEIRAALVRVGLEIHGTMGTNWVVARRGGSGHT